MKGHVIFVLSTKVVGNPRGSPPKLRRLTAEERKRAYVATLAHVSQVLRGHRQPEIERIGLTRIGPRELDGDNVLKGLKATRDGVADGLGYKSDAGLPWVYLPQEKGPYGVRVEIFYKEPE